MGLTKEDFDKIDRDIEEIIETDVEKIEIETNLPPTVEELSDSNKSYSIDCSILFIDIRKSTELTAENHSENMIKVYRSFIKMLVFAVRKNNGVTRQMLGDRIMAIFMNEKDNDGNLLLTSEQKAIECARTMQTLIDYSYNKRVNKIIDKTIECGIGITSGKVLVTQVGMRGLERVDDKENEKDVVWVGNITNYASKFCDLAKPGEIFVSKPFYSSIPDEGNKLEIWNHCQRVKDENLYEGYISNNYYLNNAQEFGDCIDKPNHKSISFDDELLISRLSKVDNIINDLLDRQKQIINKERNLEFEEKILKKEKDEIESLIKSNHVLLEYLYKMSLEILKEAYLKNEYIKKQGLLFWEDMKNRIIELGVALNINEEKIKSGIDIHMINIYYIFEEYHKAYEYLKIMARFNSHWLSDKYKEIIPRIKTKYELVSILKKRIAELNTSGNEKNSELSQELEKHVNKINEISIT